MYEKFPKKTQHPSMSVGKQEKKAFTGGKGGKREYPNKGDVPSFDDIETKTLEKAGGKGGKSKREYAQKIRHFGTEKGSLPKLRSEKPKEA